MKKASYLMMATGLIALVYGLFMDTTGGYLYGERIHNLALANDRISIILFGGFFFLGGIIIAAIKKPDTKKCETNLNEEKKVSLRNRLKTMEGRLVFTRNMLKCFVVLLSVELGLFLFLPKHENQVSPFLLIFTVLIIIINTAIFLRFVSEKGDIPKLKLFPHLLIEDNFFFLIFLTIFFLFFTGLTLIPFFGYLFSVLWLIIAFKLHQIIYKSNSSINFPHQSLSILMVLFSSAISFYLSLFFIGYVFSIKTNTVIYILLFSFIVGLITKGMIFKNDQGKFFFIISASLIGGGIGFATIFLYTPSCFISGPVGLIIGAICGLKYWIKGEHIAICKTQI